MRWVVNAGVLVALAACDVSPLQRDDGGPLEDVASVADTGARSAADAGAPDAADPPADAAHGDADAPDTASTDAGSWDADVVAPDGGVADPGWVEVPPRLEPEPRYAHMGAYDPDADRLVVVGGMNGQIGGTELSDVWVHTAASAEGQGEWQRLTPAGVGPGRIAQMASVYDPASDRLMLFGGTSGPYFKQDYFILEDAVAVGGAPLWRKPTISGTPPSERHGSTLVFDAPNDRVVLFGGREHTHRSLADVWVLSEATAPGGRPAWQQLNATGGPPAGRDQHRAVLHDNGRMIVFGGFTTASGVPWFDDVWVLRDANGLAGQPVWVSPMPRNGPPMGRFSHQVAYDVMRDRMTVHGGFLLGSTDMWFLDDASGAAATPTWMPASATSPPVATSYCTGDYDPDSDRLVCFGGKDPAQVYQNDIYVLEHATARAGTPAWRTRRDGPRGRSEHATAYHPTRDRLYLYGGRGDGACTDELWVRGQPFDESKRLRWQLVETAAAAPALCQATLHVDVTRDQLVLFGGLAPGGASADTFVLDLAAAVPRWRPVVPAAGGPTGRCAHASVLDPATGALLVVGGDDGNQRRPGIWRLDPPAAMGTPAWLRLGAAPLALADAQAVLTPRGVWILGGVGDGGFRALDEVLVIADAFTAMNVAPTPLATGGAVPPSGRAKHTASLAGDVIVVFGGETSAGVDADTFLLDVADAPNWRPLALAGSPDGRRDHTAVVSPSQDRVLIQSGNAGGDEHRADAWLLRLPSGR